MAHKILHARVKIVNTGSHFGFVGFPGNVNTGNLDACIGILLWENLFQNPKTLPAKVNK